MGFGLESGLLTRWQNVTTNNYDSLTDIQTPKITVTTAHIKSSQSFLVVARQRLPTVDVPLPLGSWTMPGLSYQLLTVTEPQQFSDWVTHQPTQPNWLNSRFLLLITSRHGPRRKHCSSDVFASVGMPRWSLLSHCLATAIVYKAITWQRLLCSCLFRGRYLAMGLHVAILCKV
jgi:hypothetical protein